MTDRRYLVVNADDFGMNPGVTRGILAAHEHGIVTSTSLMVRSASAADAVAMSRDYPSLSLGLHVEIYEFQYIENEWRLVYEVVSLSDEAAVADEIRRQHERFRELVGREPTHIDSHQHFHRGQTWRQPMLELAAELGVPLRHFTPGLHYRSVGGFYGQSTEGDVIPVGITVDGLVDTLKTLPLGITELGCHPGDASDLDTHYNSERAAEQRVLCDPAVRVALERERIALCSFAEVADLLTLRAQ